MQSHIALHLERFSLFSLPRFVACGDSDEDDAANADSDKAIGTIEDSRDEDFERDLDIDTENVRCEDAVEGPTNGPSNEVSDDLSRVPEVKHELTEEAILAINDQVDVAEVAKSTVFEDKSAVTGATVKIFENHNTPVYTVAFFPDQAISSR